MGCLTRRDFCSVVAGGVAGAALATQPIGSVAAKAAERQLPRPTSQQAAWQDMELGMFVHLDMVTFTGEPKPRQPADPNIYNPTRLDTDQWLETAKSFGAKYAVFVAKHCTGFLSWQSNAYDYGVKQSSWRGGRGDVVKDFLASCERYGIKPGLYASVTCNAYWTVDNPGIVNWGQGGDANKQAAYARVCEAMFTELWSNYGELTEIWFDGGALPTDKGGPNIVPIQKKHQPKAVVFQGPARSIRWIGNEQGVASYPCWATVSGDGDVSGGGDPDGDRWLPGECDVPLPGHDWFWEPRQDAKIRPMESLMDMYYRSVGRNCNLLLNATPDKTGLIPAANVKHYADFGKEIRRRFANPLAETHGEGTNVELTLPRPSRIDHVVIMEDITQGERIRAYDVEGLVGGERWQRLCEGRSVGHKRIERFNPVEVAKVRLRITKAVGSPVVRNLAAFCTTILKDHEVCHRD